MASIINTVKNGYGHFSGVWEDLQWYTTVKINVVSPVSGELKLNWANPPKGRLPNTNDLLITNDICYDPVDGTSPTAVTLERDAKARWFRLDFCASDVTQSSYNDNSLNIEVLYKRAPTQIGLVDNSENQIVDVGNNSLYTVLVDNAGIPLRSTDTTIGEALYTNLRDASGAALATVSGNNVNQSLAVALRDNSGDDLSTLGINGLSTTNALYVHPADASGHSQAGTTTVTDASTAGVALYLTSTPDSTLKTSHTSFSGTPNALYVHSVDKSELSHTNNNPISVKQTDDRTVVLPFDISSSVTENWRTIPALKGGIKRGRLLYNLYTYNDGPTLTWLRLYDLSVVDGSTVPTPGDWTQYIMQTIPIAPGQTYETHYPRGIQFNNGIAFRATNEPDVTSTYGPGEETIFVAGTYITSEENGTGTGGENKLYNHMLS